VGGSSSSSSTATKAPAKEVQSKGEPESVEKTVDYGAAAFAQAVARHKMGKSAEQSPPARQQQKAKVSKHSKRSFQDELDALRGRNAFTNAFNAIANVVATIGQAALAPFVLLYAVLSIFRPGAIIDGVQASAAWCKNHPRTMLCAFFGVNGLLCMRWLYTVPTRYEHSDPYAAYKSELYRQYYADYYGYGSSYGSSKSYGSSSSSSSSSKSKGSSSKYSSKYGSSYASGYGADDGDDPYATSYAYYKALQELEAHYSEEYAKDLEDWYRESLDGKSGSLEDWYRQALLRQEEKRAAASSKKSSSSTSSSSSSSSNTVSTGNCKMTSEIDKMRSAFGAPKTCAAKKTKKTTNA